MTLQQPLHRETREAYNKRNELRKARERYEREREQRAVHYHDDPAIQLYRDEKAKRGLT